VAPAGGGESSIDGPGIGRHAGRFLTSEAAVSARAVQERLGVMRDVARKSWT